MTAATRMVEGTRGQPVDGSKPFSRMLMETERGRERQRRRDKKIGED